jgi:hypothetical protein
MPANPKIIEQMRDRQKRMFRIALDPLRYGLTLKMIEADSGIDYDSLRNYAAGKTTMPITAVDSLIDVLPDALLSLLFSGGRSLVQTPEELDHDAICEAVQDYLTEKAKAHRQDSPGGPAIVDCEREALDRKITALPIGRAA